MIDLSNTIIIENFKTLFFGNESKAKKAQLDKVNIILDGQKKQIFNLWRGIAKGIRKSDRKKGDLITKLAEVRQQT